LTPNPTFPELGENEYEALEGRPERLKLYVFPGVKSLNPKLTVYVAWLPWLATCEPGVTVTPTLA
jgi:hypothetical protein